jgi:hypothetical protein
MNNLAILARTLFVGIPNAAARELICAIRGHRLDTTAPSAHGRKLCSCCHRRIDA